MTNQNTLTPSAGSQQPAPLARAGQAANQAAAAATFTDYINRKADNTLRRQKFDLILFAEYLATVAALTPPESGAAWLQSDQGNKWLTGQAEALARDPASWAGVTWGLVEGFVKWQLNQGYAVGSVNVRLSTIKTFARLASKAGAITPADYTLIRAVSGYSDKEAKRVDRRRDVTRLGRKKAAPVDLTEEQAAQLKQQPDTPQGRRDSLLMCLLLDHGLRVSEVAALEVGGFDLQRRRFTFYRAKVDREQTHKMTPDTFKAARAYLQKDAPPLGSLMTGSRRDGSLAAPGWSVQKMTARVKGLGEVAGVNSLSPHDCRHYWATLAAKNGTQIDRLQDAGGWSNPITPLTRYIRPAQIANEGVKLK